MELRAGHCGRRDDRVPRLAADGRAAAGPDLAMSDLTVQASKWLVCLHSSFSPCAYEVEDSERVPVRHVEEAIEQCITDSAGCVWLIGISVAMGERAVMLDLVVLGELMEVNPPGKPPPLAAQKHPT